MPAENLKSPSITNSDASPPVANNSGQGGSGALRSVNDHVVCTAGATAPSTYRLCRIPTNACVKQVLLNTPAGGASGAADINIAFSDSPTESASYQSFAGGIVQLAGPVDNKLFGAATALTGASAQKDITFGGTFTTTHMNMPLWQVLTTLGATQFSADPGGAFDFVLKTTASITNGIDLSMEVRFVCDG